MKSLNEGIRRTTALRLLVMLVLPVIVVPSLRAQSDADFDEYKVRITGFWFYSNPTGTLQDATTGDIISLHKDIAFSSYSTFSGKLDWKFTRKNHLYLVEAFQKGQNQGLVNALEKMKAVGRIQIPGTLGYDLSFIRLIQSPTGRTIRFVTNRKIAFGEAYYNTPSHSRSTSPPARFSLTTRTKARVQGFCTLRASSLSTRTASCRSS